MCGIVGVVGNHEVAPLLLECLKKLEYRGYDSAGIATIDHGILKRRRQVGKLINLSDLLIHDPIAGKIGIGHTRWATHGKASVLNAHPHQAGKVAVVHNGIIENYKSIRKNLIEKGHEFHTKTDTESIVKLCMDFLDQGDSPINAARKTINILKGAYALCFLFAEHDNLLIATRSGSPLIIGHGDGEMFVGSDPNALSSLTNKITYLEEGDFAVITRNSLDIWDKGNQQATREMQILSLGVNEVTKGQHRHFMSKEISEQPIVLGESILSTLNADRTAITLDNLDIDFSSISHITITGCGTAYLACYVAKYWFEQIANITADVDIASEFRYREPPIHKNSIAVFVSQSGQTADTLAALQYCKAHFIKTISVVNAAQTPIERESDYTLKTHAGIEIGVASTKAFTCQLATLLLLVLKVAKARSEITTSQEEAYIKSLLSIPTLATQILSLESQIIPIAHELKKSNHALFLGRGTMYPIALEGALKLKELSYIHAEGYASGELKHGPIALIDEYMHVVVLAPKDALFMKTISNMQEVIARGGKILLITNATDAKEIDEDIWQTIIMPDMPEILTPILYTLPLQLLAYHTAVHKGTDVDQPRNLAKSVTVE